MDHPRIRGDRARDLWIHGIFDRCKPNGVKERYFSLQNGCSMTDQAGYDTRIVIGWNPQLPRLSPRKRRSCKTSRRFLTVQLPNLSCSTNGEIGFRADRILGEVGHERKKERRHRVGVLSQATGMELGKRILHKPCNDYHHGSTHGSPTGDKLVSLPGRLRNLVHG